MTTENPNNSHYTNIKGYNFRIDDDFKSYRMEHPTDMLVKLIKLVYRLPTVNIP